MVASEKAVTLTKSSTSAASAQIVPALSTQQAATEIVVRSVNTDASLQAIESQIMMSDAAQTRVAASSFAPVEARREGACCSALSIPLGRDIVSSIASLQVNALLRDNQVLITLNAQGAREQQPIDFQVRMPNGAPLPAWLEQPSKDVLLATPPAEHEHFQHQRSLAVSGRTRGNARTPDRLHHWKHHPDRSRQAIGGPDRV